MRRSQLEEFVSFRFLSTRHIRIFLLDQSQRKPEHFGKGLGDKTGTIKEKGSY